MTYQQAFSYLNSFINYEDKDKYAYKKSFRPEKMREFLRLLGNPQDGLKCLHIAGTKGKGSVCVFAANILRAAGYKVGLYTSPHLMDWRERVRILGSRVAGLVRLKTGDRRPETGDCFEGMISRRELAALVERLKPVIERYSRVSKSGDLTLFEVFTALAFLYFKEEKVDYAVLETGLGGRLDATNVAHPLACAITPISYDHMQYLGNTLKLIAKEKAGIIKRQKAPPQRLAGPPIILAEKGKRQNLVVISALQEKEAREVIRKRCAEKKAKLYEIGKDIAWQKNGFKAGLQYLDLKGIRRGYNNLEIRLLGKHQLGNAALAVGLVEVLGKERIRPAHIRQGLKDTLWPGRLETVSRNPCIVLDGAQNAASALALKEAIREYFRYQKLILALGMSRDKDIPGFCRESYDFCDIVVLTKADNPRAADPRDLAEYFRGKEIFLSGSVKKAIAKAKAIAKKEDLILITGSLFVVGEARKVLNL